MNKKGQSLGIAIMGTIFILIIGLMCVNFLFDEVDTARADLGCSTPNSISDGSKLLCLVVDTGIPYWIWIILSVSVGLILVRFMR